MLIADTIRDFGLNYVLANAGDLVLCSAEPTTYQEATSLYRLAIKCGVTVLGPISHTVLDGFPADGRHVYVDTFSDGVTEKTGTGTHLALLDSVNQALLAVTAVDTPVATGGPARRFWLSSPFYIWVENPT